MIYNDAELIQQTLKGDQQAFAALVEKYQKQIHTLAWQKIGDFHIAQEVTQDVFLTAYHKLTTLKNPNRLSGWLYVIANRKCIAWHRKKKPQPQSLDAMTPIELEEVYYSVHITQQREDSANQKRRELVQKLLSKLQESERTVVNLYYIAEMTCEDIGKFLGVSPNTVRSRLHRARNRLRKEEMMIRENINSFQLPTKLTENIMRKISRIKPAVLTSSKPIMPWVIAASTLAVVLLMLGFGNLQHLTLFQKPYNFDATTEMTVDIIDTPLIANLDAKPDVRTQIGSPNASDTRDKPKQQSDNKPEAVVETQEDETVENHIKWELPKEAKARFGKGGINLLRFSPDGQQLAVGSSIGVWLYDVETGKELSMFPGKSTSIAFSPDGRFLASSVDGQSPQLWELTTRKKMVITDHLSRTSVLRFSADGKTLITLSNIGDSISQLDLKTGKVKVKHIAEQIESVSAYYFALTHDKFASIRRRTEIELWDPTTGEILSTLKGKMSISAMVFSPDGTRLASSGRTYDSNVTLQLWDTESREQLWDAESKGSSRHLTDATEVNALAFSHDGKMLASGGTDMTVQVRDSATGEPITTLTGHTNGITALTFSSDNRTLASGSADGTVRFWNIKKGKSLPIRITGHTIQMETVTFYKDSNTLVSVAHDGVVSFWDVKTLQQTDTKTLQKTYPNPIRDFPAEGLQYWLSTVAFSPDGTKIISAGVKGHRIFSGEFLSTAYIADLSVRLSDVKTGHEVQTMDTAGGATSITFSPDGKTVALGVHDKILVWNTDTGDTFDIPLDKLSFNITHLNQDDISKFPHHIQSKMSAFNPEVVALVFLDDKRIISGTKDGKIQMWDVETGVPLDENDISKFPLDFQSKTFRPEAAVLVFSPNGKRIISGTKDGKVQMWEAETGVLLTDLFVGEEPKAVGISKNTHYNEVILTVAVSSDGNLIAIASNKRIQLLHLLPDQKNALLKEIPYSGTAFAFSHDNTLLVIGLKNGKIELCDTKTGNILTTLGGHTATVKSLIFSPDGKTLVSTGEDGTILLWDWDEVLKGTPVKEK